MCGRVNSRNIAHGLRPKGVSSMPLFQRLPHLFWEGNKGWILFLGLFRINLAMVSIAIGCIRQKGGFFNAKNVFFFCLIQFNLRVEKAANCFSQSSRFVATLRSPDIFQVIGPKTDLLSSDFPAQKKNASPHSKDSITH